MAVLQPPGWLQNAGNVHSASELRSYMATMLAGNYLSATTLRARGGVNPALGNQCVVTQTGSPSMAVVVSEGSGCIPGTVNSTQGNYFFVNDAVVTLSIAAAHASLPRIDIVVVNVRDSQYSGVDNDVQLQVVTGTPASSPVAPTAPDNSITLAQVAVGAGVSSIVTANITDVRNYMAGLGGVIMSRNDGARPSSAEIVESQLVWSNDVNRLYVWDGAAYSGIPTGFTPWQTWTPTLTNLTLGNGTLVARYIQVAKMFTYFFKFKLGSTSAVTGSPIFSLPVTAAAHYSSTDTDVLGFGTLLDFGTLNTNAVGRIQPGNNAVNIVNASGTGHSLINGTTPWTWTTNDVISISGTFEVA